MSSSRWFIAVIFAFVGLLSAQTPVVTPDGLLNAASFATSGQPGFAIAPGALAAIFGTDLASSLSAADTIPLSNSLGNVSVKINDAPAPLLFASQGQINVQIPWEVDTSSGTATVVVTHAGVASAPQTIQVNTFSPGVFFDLQTDGRKLAIATDATGILAQPAGSINKTTTHPVPAGQALIIYATGLGPLDHPPEDGAIPPAGVLANTKTKPVVLIGGVQAKVLFSGQSPSFVGVNQLNVIVPASVPAGDAVPLQIQLGGVTTSDSITIAVQ